LTEVVLVSKLGTGLDKLDFKLGTVLDRKCRTVLVLDVKLGSKLGTGLGVKLRTELESKLVSRLGSEVGGRVPLTEAVLVSKL
jgi:hypothetical protein